MAEDEFSNMTAHQFGAMESSMGQELYQANVKIAEAVGACHDASAQHVRAKAAVQMAKATRIERNAAVLSMLMLMAGTLLLVGLFIYFVTWVV